MKPITLGTFTMGLCLMAAPTALGQFNSGSTGVDGPLNITTNTTLDLPPDGIFNFTTVNVASGANLNFKRNALNTPVYLLATGDVTISGRIEVSGSDAVGTSAGRGGPGGFDGGFGAWSLYPAGAGQGPGGGPVGQTGVFANAQGGNTNIYGNTLLNPLIGGSGGGGNGGSGGGGGGGGLLVASSKKISLNYLDQYGNVRSVGGGGAGGSTTGSGGGIRLVAPVISGNGKLVAVSGSGNSLGRIRIDSIDRFEYRNLQYVGNVTRGSQMFVFPPGNPRLDIVNAAGTQIPEGTNAPVIVNLPVGSSTNQFVRVQARGFTNDIPIRVKITPENAPSATFDGVIPQNSGNPPFADVQVTLPVDTVCYVHAWTR